jgi:hypothetical protein
MASFKSCLISVILKYSINRRHYWPLISKTHDGGDRDETVTNSQNEESRLPPALQLERNERLNESNSNDGPMPFDCFEE